MLAEATGARGVVTDSEGTRWLGEVVATSHRRFGSWRRAQRAQRHMHQERRCSALTTGPNCNSVTCGDRLNATNEEKGWNSRRSHLNQTGSNHSIHYLGEHGWIKKLPSSGASSKCLLHSGILLWQGRGLRSGGQISASALGRTSGLESPSRDWNVNRWATKCWCQGRTGKR